MPPAAASTEPSKDLNFSADKRCTCNNNPNPKSGRPWSTSKSSSLYKINGWGAPYFFVNSCGHMAARPHGLSTNPNEEVDLMKVIREVIKPRNKGGCLGLSTPVIVRFPHILKDRLESLQSAFDNAIRVTDYEACFRGVYPVKCNQDCSVVESIVRFGKPYGFGLESGSKPELLLSMASLCHGSPHSLLICNGYKDSDYVCLALLARKMMGLDCIIVLEQEEELDLVLNISRKLCIEPVIGLRAKLHTKHAGHFGDTSGEKSKFGLTCSEIIQVVNKLRNAGKLECLRLLHFHIGSQIPSLPILNDGVTEATHIYCELALMGACMKIIDIGGGLGIDYDGTNSTHSNMSIGYTMEEYALEVVQAVKHACDKKGVKQPMLCSESGRALVSHHSVLVLDVIHSHLKNRVDVKGGVVALDLEGVPTDIKDLHARLLECMKSFDYDMALECGALLKNAGIERFKQGEISLTQMAAIANIYDAFVKHEGKSECIHDAIYHINLSIFKSMPDTWAIGQLFPIVPLHRLEEEPCVKAILSDLTCDSDGKITSFVGKEDAIRGDGRDLNYIKVHRLLEGKAYYMGMFLGGAYQEALGSLHNLFGSPNVVEVAEGLRVTKGSMGQTTSDVLKLMKYEPICMLETIKTHIQKALSCSNGNDDDDDDYDEKEASIGLIHTLACSFDSSTYLTTNNVNVSAFRKGSIYNAAYL